MNANIKYVWDLNRTLAEGPYAWPGGYPKYFATADGQALSWKAVEANVDLVRDAVITQDKSSDWLVIAVDVNWEDASLYCAHTSKPIECAYGNED